MSRDHSAVVVLGVRRPEQREDTTQLRLAHIKRWKPTAGQKVDLMDVEEELRRVVRRYRPTLGIDPWQAELLAQRLTFDGADVRHVTPTAANLRDQATRVREVFTDRRIRLYDAEGLRDDVERLRIKETSYGQRLESPRDKRRGHGDAASALCCALSVAGDVISAPSKVPHFL